jgi:hypothetical protein
LSVNDNTEKPSVYRGKMVEVARSNRVVPTSKINNPRALSEAGKNEMLNKKYKTIYANGLILYFDVLLVGVQ